MATLHKTLRNPVSVLIGALGLVGFLLRFVGPLTIAPVLIQIGISLTMPAVDYCKGNWAVAIIVMFVLILCMEILARFAIPIPGYNFEEKKCTLVKKYPILEIPDNTTT